MKIRHDNLKWRKVKIHKVYDSLHKLNWDRQKHGQSIITKEECMQFFAILGDVELCRQIKLNLPRTKKMERWLSKLSTVK